MYMRLDRRKPEERDEVDVNFLGFDLPDVANHRWISVRQLADPLIKAASREPFNFRLIFVEELLAFVSDDFAK